MFSFRKTKESKDGNKSVFEQLKQKKTEKDKSAQREPPSSHRNIDKSQDLAAFGRRNRSPMACFEPAKSPNRQP